MLQAMNTGHDGSLTTVHANGPRDALSRMETLCLMAGVDLPLLVIRRQMASAINLIIQQNRMKDGSRKVVQVSEIEGIQGETITMQDLFVYRTPGHTGPGPSLGAGGRLEPTGMRPHLLPRIKEYGFAIDQSLFNKTEPQRPTRADGRPASSGSR
jgi:pilus assembly protein CpaF